MPNKRMQEQRTDHNQGPFLQNFWIFKVVLFNNFFVTNRIWKYIISFSCPFNSLYEYIIVAKSMIAHFVDVIIYFLGLCRNKCQLLDFIQIFQRIFKKSKEKVELHEKGLLITFWRRQVRKSMIAHFVDVIIYFLGLCRNKCQLLDFIQIFQRIFKKSKEKVELHEKILLITFWRRQVLNSMIAHLVAVINYFLGLCRNKCQLLDFIQIFQRIFKKSEEKFELHEKNVC